MKEGKLLTVLLLTVFAGCSSDTAQDAIDDTFVQIVEATWRDWRIYTIPCKTNPAALAYNGNRILPESIATERNIDDCDRRIELLRKDTLGMIVEVGTTSSKSNPYKIDLTKHSNRKFLFVQHLPKIAGKIRAPELHYRKYTGMLHLSAMAFNADHDRATLLVEYSCGSRCGFMYKVYLKKSFWRWEVEKVEEIAVF